MSWRVWGYFCAKSCRLAHDPVAWRSIPSLGARLVVLRALRTGIFVLSKKYTAPPLTLDVVAGVVVDGWRRCLRRVGSLDGQVFFNVFAVHLGLIALGDDFAS